MTIHGIHGTLLYIQNCHHMVSIQVYPLYKTFTCRGGKDNVYLQANISFSCVVPHLKYHNIPYFYIYIPPMSRCLLTFSTNPQIDLPTHRQLIIWHRNHCDHFVSPFLRCSYQKWMPIFAILPERKLPE